MFEDYLAEDLTNNMLTNMQNFLLMHVNISSWENEQLFYFSKKY